MKKRVIVMMAIIGGIGFLAAARGPQDHRHSTGQRGRDPGIHA